jgi:hypothetical protein
MVKSTVPAEFPHHYWTLDELLATVWIKAFHPVLRLLVSVRPWVVLIADNFSRVPVGFYVCEPFRGMTTTVGFDSEEVMGAFFSAAIPDLAPPETRAFTGYLPRILRMDGASQHNQLKLALRKQGVGAEKLEKGTPWSRGSVERLIGGIDSICQPIRGHMAGIIPTDQVKKAPEELRTGAAATSLRHRRKHVVAVESLPTLSEFREAFAREIHRYAVERKHSMIGVTPEITYFNHLRPEELRSGLDATLMLPPVTLTVGKGGLMHRKAYFAPEVAGRKLNVGEQLVCRPDPLKRGLFVEVSGQPAFVPSKEEWARTQNPEHLVGEEKAIAKEYSEAAAAAQRRILAERFKGAETAPVASPGKGAPEVWDRTPLVEPNGEDADVADDAVATSRKAKGTKGRRSKAKAAPSAPPVPVEATAVRPTGDEEDSGGEDLGADAAVPMDEAAGAETVRPVFRVVPGASKPSAAVPGASSLPRGLVRSRKAHLRVEK